MHVSIKCPVTPIPTFIPYTHLKSVSSYRYAPRCSWLRGYLAHTDGVARQAAARLLGAAASELNGPAAEALMRELAVTFSGAVSAANAAVAAAVASPPVGSPTRPEAASHSSNVRPTTKFEEQEGCILALGEVAYDPVQMIQGTIPYHAGVYMHDQP